MSLKETVLVKGDKYLKLNITCGQGSSNATYSTSEFVFNDVIKYKLKIAKLNVRFTYSVLFTNDQADDKNIYTARYAHLTEHDGIITKTNKCLTSSADWQQIEDVWFESDQRKTSISLTITEAKIAKFIINRSASLYDDTELTDFEIEGDDGSVKLHMAIAAAASPVLKGMFSGQWRETAQGVVKVPNTTKKALQHLKDYMYLEQLPADNGLEQLLLLASYYMMFELKVLCEDKLLSNLRAENAYDLIQFAVEHKMSQLLIRILDSIQDWRIFVDDMRNHV